MNIKHIFDKLHTHTSEKVLYRAYKLFFNTFASEQRIKILTTRILLGWLISLAVTMLAVVVPDFLADRFKRSNTHHEIPSENL